MTKSEIKELTKILRIRIIDIISENINLDTESNIYIEPALTRLTNAIRSLVIVSEPEPEVSLTIKGADNHATKTVGKYINKFLEDDR